MNDADMILDQIIPEKIIDCKFKEMSFTMEMLDVYFAVNGRKSLIELSDQLSMDLAKLVIYIKRMTQMGIIRVRNVDRTFAAFKEKDNRQFCYRGVVYYK